MHLLARLLLSFVAAVLLASPPVRAQAVDEAVSGEIARLASTPALQEAFRHIESLEQQTLADLVRLVEIPAPPFEEAARARAYVGMLEEAGADSVWIDAEGNVVGLRRGSTGERTVAVTAHLDTVFPEGTDVTVRTRGDTLFAPGIGDDARGLVEVLTLLRAMVHAGIRTEADVLFVGTVGEEGLGDLRGVKHLFRDDAPRIDAFLSLDAGSVGEIIHRALGSIRYRVTFEGSGGHSWSAFGTANPAHALGRAVRLFDERAAAFVAQGPRTSYNVGRIGGGTSVNAIPASAWMEVDLRSEDQGRLQAIAELFRASMEAGLAEENEGRAMGDSLTVTIDPIGLRPSGSLAVESPLVQRAIAAGHYFGIESHLRIASTDANVPLSRGVPAMTIGRGGIGGGAHGPDEWWINRDGHVAIQRTLLLVVAEAGLAR